MAVTRVTELGGGDNDDNDNVIFHDVNTMIAAIEKVSIFFSHSFVLWFYARFLLGAGDMQRYYQ
jgi:hypothetical protein